VDVADGDELDSGFLLGGLHDAGSLAADADRGHHDLAVWPGLLDLLCCRVALLRLGNDLPGIPERQPGGRQGRERTIQKSSSRQRYAMESHSPTSQYVWGAPSPEIMISLNVKRRNGLAPVPWPRRMDPFILPLSRPRQLAPI